MAKIVIFSLLTTTILILGTTTALAPFYTTPRSMWDQMTMIPFELDPLRILEQTPTTMSQDGSLAVARADWRETPESHVIEVEVPGMTREQIKVEVEENRVLRVSGERKTSERVEGDKWHRAERIVDAKFWRRFRMPGNADLDKIKASLDNGVLRVVVPKLAEEVKRQPKEIAIEEATSSTSTIPSANINAGSDKSDL